MVAEPRFGVTHRVKQYLHSTGMVPGGTEELIRRVRARHDSLQSGRPGRYAVEIDPDGIQCPPPREGGAAQPAGKVVVRLRSRTSFSAQPGQKKRRDQFRDLPHYRIVAVEAQPAATLA